MSIPTTLLIVDDSPEDRESYIRILKKIPDVTYRYMEASDGKKCLEMIESKSFDCVLLDYSLPGMNGIDVLKSLRVFQQFLPVILLTGQGNEAIAAQSIKDGANDYLVKSDITSEKLHDSIRIAINQANLKKKIADIKYQVHQTSLELAQSEERYELVMQGMSVGLWDWNVETGESYWSQKFLNILGMSISVNSHSHQEFIQKLHPDDKERVEKAIQSHLENNTPYNIEYRLLCNDGEYVWIHSCGQAKWGKNGRPERMVGSVNDITEHKKLQTQRETLIEKLSESNSELERFAHTCSHDLQEPLRMIHSFAELLKESLENKLDSEQKNYMEYIMDGAVRARQLVRDLLSYAKAEDSREVFEDINLEEFIDNILKDLEVRINEVKAVITYDVVPVIRTQPTHLRLLLQNLLTNAMKFCKKPPHIHIKSEYSDGVYRFSVQDNGIGIAKEHIEKIFNIFERLHRYDDYPGTGIGLALCKKLVQKYGGDIWVESVDGEGSCFFFTLPKEKMEVAGRKNEAA